MTNMFSIARIVVLILIITAAAVLAYYLFYYRRINARIASGDTSGKRMPGVPSMITAAVITALVIYSAILTIAVQSRSNQVYIENRDTFTVIDLSDYTRGGYTDADADASYAKNFSREENEGYSRKVVEAGDFTFTVFTRNEIQDAFHPDFFCFVDYSGAIEEGYSLYQNYSYTETASQENKGGVGSGGDFFPEGFLVVGNMNTSDTFEISMAVLDGNGEEALMEADEQAFKDDKGDFPDPEDYAITKGSVIITIQQ